MSNLEHFDRLFLFFAAGLALLLAGGVNVVLGSGGRRGWLRAATTLAVCAAAVGALAALTRPELAVRAAAVLVGVLLVATLFGSDWLARRLVAAGSYARKPLPRWGGVALLGLAVIVGSGVAFEQSEEQAAQETTRDLEVLVGRPPARPAEGVQATTDRGTPVVVREPISPRAVEELREAEEKSLRTNPLLTHLVRKGEATDVSNCHGFVFTGGRYLVSPDDVELILRENDYHETPKPRAGDLVVYRDGVQAITHTAIVEYVAKGKPVLVEGKWGAMGTFQHPVDRSSYGTNFTYYRSSRQGHLLVGLGGSPASPELPGE